MADVKMPKLGESVTEGTIGRWLKQVGDRIEKYEALAEVVTDKVTAELPSDYVGILQEILVQENETVAVGTPVARIVEEGVATASVPNGEETAQRQPSPAPIAPPSTGARYSPAVLTLAQEHGIALEKIGGTGLGGRVTRKDVLAALATPPAAVHEPPAVPVTAATSSASSAEVPRSAAGTAAANEQWIPVTPIRRTIAQRMVDSKRQAPHAWMMVEVDVTSLVKIRERLKAGFKEREGFDLTYFPFFMKAVVDGLKEFPILNATWAEDMIVVKRDINLSIAVAANDSLVVPVIHQADRLSIFGLAAALQDLVKKAKSGKLAVADMQGGTFTVNNTGAFGSILSQPILNAPQAAILSVESIVKRPVVLAGDSIAIRSMVNLCVSLDHRVLDGWVVGQFMKTVKHRLESMDESVSLY